MIKKVLKICLFIFIVFAGILFSLALDHNTNDQNDSYDFNVNDNGQTYGSAILSEHEAAIYPDLVLALGIDGVEGYVLKDDLDGTGPLSKPRNPDEALVYMDQVDELIAATMAKAKLLDLESHEVFLYYIPLYASDGITVIGEFGISIPSEDYPALDLN